MSKEKKKMELTDRDLHLLEIIREWSSEYEKNLTAIIPIKQYEKRSEELQQHILRQLIGSVYLFAEPKQILRVDRLPGYWN